MASKEPVLTDQRQKSFCEQVSKSEEALLYKDCSPEEYAGKVWRMVGERGIMTPLQGIVSEAELAAIKPLYTKEVVQVAKRWVVEGGILNPYTMLWVTATK